MRHIDLFTYVGLSITFDAAQLDCRQTAIQNEAAMRKRLARSTAPITWTLILAFSVTLSASCTTEPTMTEAAMACCAAMGHECAKSDDEHDCCARETSQVEQLLITKQRVDLAAPALKLITAVILPTATLSGRQFSHVRDAVFAHPIPTRVPKYLLASSLLI